LYRVRDRCGRFVSVHKTSSGYGGPEYTTGLETVVLETRGINDRPSPATIPWLNPLRFRYTTSRVAPDDSRDGDLP
jgi:hypothetical protein